MIQTLPQEAIVLAGGFGTRLRQVVSDVPKPMAPMDDKGAPFLAFVLKQLAGQGIKTVILSVGYMADVIQRYFGDSYAGMKLLYSVEDEPLGTGGAVKKALTMCSADIVFVLNGDTYFDVNFLEMAQKHHESGADFTLASREMIDFDRYGALSLTADDRVTSFGEKQYCAHGYINGGIYCMRKDIFADVEQMAFSLEKDFLEKKVDELYIVSYKENGFFIDIGIPEDYRRAKQHWTSRG